MRRIIGLYLYLVISLCLSADGMLMYQPDYDIIHELPSEEVIFPFPLLLDDSLITITYVSPLSCRLVLKGNETEARLALPPLDGASDRSRSITLMGKADFAVSSLKLLDWDGKPVPFRVSLTEVSGYTDTVHIADHQTILTDQRELTDDFILYRWSTGNNILIFDFKNYQIQDLYLKRLAFFMEKPGYRGTLMTNEEMEELHGWNAHDYSKEGLASFFTLAEEQDFILNGEEEELRQILLNRGILFFDGEQYLTGEGAIVSITRESSSVLRQRFLTHESLHGLFFTDEEFRESIRAYWYGMPDNYRDIWRFFMENNFYDPEDQVLMYNEMLGYTLQLHRKEVENYFVWRFNRIGEVHPEKAAYIKRIVPYIPEVMLQIYDQLEYIAALRYSYRNGSFHEAD